MPKKKYKALFVDEPTHNKVAVLAKKNKMTIDAFILQLVKSYERTSK